MVSDHRAWRTEADLVKAQVGQIGLRGLAVAVLGSAYVFNVARPMADAGGGLLDHRDAWLCLIGIAMAVWLVLSLGRGAVAMGLGRASFRDPRVLARWIVLALLAWMTVQAAATIPEGVSLPPAASFFRQALTARMRLAAYSLAFGILGALLAFGPLRFRTEDDARRIRSPLSIAASVIWAILGGIAVVGLWDGIIVYLVAIAIEAVRNALQNSLEAPPSILLRVYAAGIRGSIGLLLAATLAIRVELDVRRVALGAPHRPGWFGTAWRLLLILFTALWAYHLSTATLNDLQPAFAEGFGYLITPEIAGLIACGFTLLALGLVVQGNIGPAPTTDPPADESAGRSVPILAGIVALIGILAGFSLRTIHPDLFIRLVYFVPCACLYLWVGPGWFRRHPWISAGGAAGLLYHDSIVGFWFDRATVCEIVLWAIAAVVLRRFMTSRPDRDRTTLLDHQLQTPGGPSHLLVCWLGLTVAMLAALPSITFASTWFIQIVLSP